MPGLEALNVSLTKNGYFKVADVIEKHPRHEVLSNIRGRYPGINLDRAQIANMLSVDPVTKELPEEWDLHIGENHSQTSLSLPLHRRKKPMGAGEAFWHPGTTAGRRRAERLVRFPQEAL